jgi:hypothetical protein
LLKHLTTHEMEKYMMRSCFYVITLHFYVMNAYFYVIVRNFYVIKYTQSRNRTKFPVIFFFLGENV